MPNLYQQLLYLEYYTPFLKKNKTLKVKVNIINIKNIIQIGYLQVYYFFFLN